MIKDCVMHVGVDACANSCKIFLTCSSLLLIILGVRAEELDGDMAELDSDIAELEGDIAGSDVNR